MKLAELLKEEIYSGKYKPGTKLPSVQRLSNETGMNSDTIVKAYNALLREHIIYSVPKSGFYVMKNEIGRKIIDMNNINLPNQINPYIDFQHCLEKAIKIYGPQLFQYGSPRGMDELIQVLPKHLNGMQVFTKSENIFITNGAQQALHIISAMKFPNRGSKILLEQPTYSLMLKILKHLNIPALGIARDHNGVNLNYLEKMFQQGDIKFFYTMPRYQNPTGFSYSNSQKKEITKLAERYGVFILEDDYLLDLEVDQKSDALHTLGNKENIIYLRSFSKTLLPGLRLGMVVMPEVLKKQFLEMKYCMDLNTPILTQAALEIFLTSSMYRHHVKRTKDYYKNKMDILRKLCNKAQDKIVWHIPSTGLYAYLETGKHSSLYLEKKLFDNKVLVSSTNSNYIDGFEHPEGLRLCVCSAENHDIEHVVKIIEHHCNIS